MNNKDYYEILGVAKNASQEDIKKTYRKKAMKYHPDTNDGDKAKEEKFKEISEAYEILSDEQERAYYDRVGSSRKDASYYSPQHDDMSDIFSNFMGGFSMNAAEGFRWSFTDRNVSNMGSAFNRPDNVVTLRLSMANAIKGGRAKINLKRIIACDKCQGRGFNIIDETCSFCKGQGQVRRGSPNFSFSTPCTVCKGTGKKTEECDSCCGKRHSTKEESIVVKIPAGIQPSTKLKIENKGNEVYFGGKKVQGHTFVIIDYPSRENGVSIEMGDIHASVNVSFHLALDDSEITVNILGVKEIKLKLSHKHKSGHKYKVKGKGWTEGGHAFIKVFIDLPKKDISEESRQKLAKLTREVYGMHEGTFEPCDQG